MVTMVTEDYVSFEIAKLLKEKGFDKYPLFPCYKEDETKLFIDIPTTLDTINYRFIPAPTLQMAMKWLREVQMIGIEIFIDVEVETQKKPLFSCQIWTLTPPYRLEIDGDIENQEFKTYEEACEAAIKYCLENLV